MNETKKGECEHVNFERDGLWDGESETGEPVGGPVIHCDDCGQKISMTWEVFKSIRRNEQR